jgi:hypothetical protein
MTKKIEIFYLYIKFSIENIIILIMHSTISITKSCDGNFILFGRKDLVTMNLTKDTNGVFSYNLVGNGNTIVYSETLTKKKFPVFSEKTFSVLGQNIFETEKDSTARFLDMKRFFDYHFDAKYDYLIYNNNNYEGEAKDNIPNGNGILYYGKTFNIMIKSLFVKGYPEGATTFYSSDQNIELICDDICNMTPVQYGTVIFKNLGIEKEIEFDDFNQNYPNLLKKIDINTFVHTVANFVLKNDKHIEMAPETFIFSNKTQEQQYIDIFNMLMEIKSRQSSEITRLANIRKSNLWSFYLQLFFAISAFIITGSFLF